MGYWHIILVDLIGSKQVPDGSLHYVRIYHLQMSFNTRVPTETLSPPRPHIQSFPPTTLTSSNCVYVRPSPQYDVESNLKQYDVGRNLKLSHTLGVVA